MDTNTLQSLNRCALFAGIDPQRLSALLEDAGVQTESHTKGALVRQQGDRYSRLILLTSGRLVARFESTTGKGMIVEHFEAPATVASAILTSSEPILPVSLIAEEDVVLATIGYEAMVKLLAGELSILKAFLALTGDNLRFLADKMRLMRFGSLRLKIAGHLLTLSAQQGTDRPKWRYSREQMADLLGVARPSLSRELSRMAREGLVDISERSVVGLNAEGLQELMEKEN